jgi:D-glycero-D-manno-heptose 1,7-bisphosphate phosphatase
MKNKISNNMLGRKTLFLDRDGVININHGYVFQQAKFEFIDGIFSLCQQAKKKGYQIIIVTNQSGIARKYYSNSTFKKLSKWLENQFSKQGILITQTLHCPHHPKFNGTCTCRKPKPGMIFKAQRRFKVNLAQSIMVGDSLSDMDCARQAKIKKSVFFTPNSLQYGPKLMQPRFKPYYQARCLKAIEQIL